MENTGANLILVKIVLINGLKNKKQENLKRTNKQSWKGEIGDNSFVMLYSTLYNSTAYRDLKPISKDIYIGMVLYAKGNFITEYPHRIYKNICSKSTFQTSIKSLVEHGFIDIISSGKFNHSPNKYQFCDKCKNCKEECLKYCDRFYCRRLNVAQISVKGKKKTVGSDTVQKNATDKKNKAIAKIQNGTYLDKSSITLFQIAVDIQDEKLNNGDINENTYGRNLESIEYIKKILGENLKIQKATSEDIKKLLRSKRDEGKSQSDINKLYNIVNASFRKAVLDKIITTADNPMNYIDIPISKKIKKEVIAFEVEEQATLLQYINTHTIITDTKSAYDDITVKNLIRTAFLIGARCGELGGLDYTKHIDWELERVVIERTLTKNKERKIVMGATTKTGRKNIKSNNSATRFIPFDVFDKEQLIDILEEQIIIANNNPSNCEHLLFCKKDGSYIIPSQINQIFKRVCREAGIKTNLVTGCNTHMTKHTFVTRAIESGMSLLTISKLVGTSVRELEKTYAHVLDKFMKVELEGLRKHLKNSKIIAFPKAKSKVKSIS